MRILIAIVSCKRDIPTHQAIRDTWLTGCPHDYGFFLGCKGTKSDEVELKARDDYEGVSYKSREIYRFAKFVGYDCIFQCGRDTYVRPEKFLPPLLHDENYIGFVLDGVNYCSGGAGVWFTKRAFHILANCPVDDNVDDRWVGKHLAERGIKATHTRTHMPWRVPITKSNDVVAVHLSKGTGNYDPAWMREVHAEWESS